jgi:hypothetical protein
MEVQLENEKRHFCDVCADEIEDFSEFTVTVDYGSEDECYGCWEGEHELMEELDDRDSVWQYLSQPEFIQCEECRNHNFDHYLRKFEEAFRSNRVKVIRKLIEKKYIPEFVEDAEVKKERLEHWEGIKETIIANMKDGLSDYGYESKSKELCNVMEKIRKYQ